MLMFFDILMHVRVPVYMLMQTFARCKLIVLTINLELNPLDYVYQAIGCGISLLDEESAEAQYILKYIYSSCKLNT